MHVLAQTGTHSCVCPKGELSELHLEDTDYAVDLIQLQKRKGGEGRRDIPYFAVRISQKTGKAKSAGRLDSWDVPSLTSSLSAGISGLPLQM